MVLRHLKSFLHEHNCYYEKIGNEVKDITEEIPFEIPNSWSLCRLSIVANVFTGDSINETEKAKKYIGLNDGYNYIGTKDVAYNHDINYNNGVKIPFSNMTFKIAHKGTPLLCIEGGSAGRKIGITNQDVCFGNKLCAFETIGMNADYLYYYLQSHEFRSIFKANTTGLIGGVSINTIKALPFALPPLYEQQRIVKVIRQYLSVLIGIDVNQEKHFKNKTALKNRILSLAIQGKLVPQDENDEPASVLLERIREEKKKQLGKKFVDSYIYKGDDNCYYEKIGEKTENINNEITIDLPNGWAFCRMKSIIDLISGRDLEKEYYNSINNGLPYITGASNIENNKIIINRWTTNPAAISHIGDLLLTCKGTVGKLAYNTLGDMHIARQIMAIRTTKELLPYVEIVVKANITNLQSSARSMIPGVDRDTVLNLIVPLPPLDEQRRIVSTINNVLNVIKDEN